MLLHFNGEAHTVSEESIAELLDMLFNEFLKQYGKLDRTHRVLMTPIARGLVHSWKKADKEGVFPDFDKKSDPSLNLIQMILQFVEYSARDFEAEVLIKDEKAYLSWYHPLLSPNGEEANASSKTGTEHY